MKKFFVIYMASPELMAKWSETPKEEQKKGMDEWLAWQEAHQADIVEMGTPLGKNMKVSGSGSEESRNGVCGYSIVQAESIEDATKLMADNPHVKQGEGAWIDVMECMPM